MRETRPSGSEGGGPGKLPGLPTPISRALAAERKAVGPTGAQPTTHPAIIMGRSLRWIGHSRSTAGAARRAESSAGVRFRISQSESVSHAKLIGERQC